MGHWYCPRCELQHVTQRAEVHTPFHNCRRLNGLSVPFVEDGTKAKLVVVEREDYVGKDKVQLDGAGRPVMSVQTVRDEGEDCTVYAPAAGAAAAAG